MEATSLRFALAARALGTSCRERGLVTPMFRSPPRVSGADRTVRRWRGGGATVSVVLRGRPRAAVVGDMVGGVVVANRLGGVEATRLRTALWESVVQVQPEVEAPPAPARAEPPRTGRPVPV